MLGRRAGAANPRGWSSCCARGPVGTARRLRIPLFSSTTPLRHCRHQSVALSDALPRDSPRNTFPSPASPEHCAPPLLRHAGQQHEPGPGGQLRRTAAGQEPGSVTGHPHALQGHGSCRAARRCTPRRAPGVVHRRAGLGGAPGRRRRGSPARKNPGPTARAAGTSLTPTRCLFLPLLQCGWRSAWTAPPRGTARCAPLRCACIPHRSAARRRRGGLAPPRPRLPPLLPSQEAIFETHHPSQRFVNVRSQYRWAPRAAPAVSFCSLPLLPPRRACRPLGLLPGPPPPSPCSNTFPPSVWEKIEAQFPGRRRTHPVCVDIAIGAEGRGGVELARRGFHVVGVEADPTLLARTFRFAQVRWVAAAGDAAAACAAISLCHAAAAGSRACTDMRLLWRPAAAAPAPARRRTAPTSSW